MGVRVDKARQQHALPKVNLLLRLPAKGHFVAWANIRHKTVKPAFQTVFWLTVMLNMMALGGLLYWDLSRLP